MELHRQVKVEVLGVNPFTWPVCPPQSPTQTGTALNPGLCSERPGTSRLASAVNKVL
jgi:hypothetical protein